RGPVSALRANRALRRPGARPDGARAAGPGDDHVRDRGGELRQQRRTRRRARTARLARPHGVEPRRAQLDLVARQLASASRTPDARRMDLNVRDEQVGEARLIAYGHYGRPLLVFPSEL